VLFQSLVIAVFNRLPLHAREMAIQVASFAKLLTHSLCAAMSIYIVNAIPAEVTHFPKVIAGPGLPTPESLGLTSEELYTRVPSPDVMSQIAPLFNLECGEVPPACAVSDAVACANFLIALGQQACVVNGENVEFCTAGSCHWFGSNISGGPSASSFCVDVATGGNVVIDVCQGFGSVDGANAANGNGNLIVTISGES